MVKKSGDSASFFEKEIKTKPGQMYVFLGDEDYLKNSYTERLKAVLFGDGDGFNFDRLDGGILTPETLAESLDTLPVFGERRMVVVEDFIPSEIADGDEELFIQLLNDLPEYICLVIELGKSKKKKSAGAAKKSPSQEPVSAENTANIDAEDEPSGERKKGEEKGKRLSGLLEKSGRAIKCETPDERELADFVAEIMAKNNRRISVSDAAYMISLCAGYDMQRIYTEAVKLTSSGKNSTVTRSEITESVTPSAQVGAFDITNYIAEGNMAQALTVYRKLLQSGENNIVLAGMILASFKRLYAVKLAVDERLPDSIMVSRLRLSEKALPVVKRKATGYDLSKLRLCVQWSAENCYALQSSAVDNDLIMESFIIRITNMLSRRQPV